MDSSATPTSSPLRAPVRSNIDNGLLVNENAATFTRPSHSKENPKKRDNLVEQSTLQSAASCSFGSQLNFQLDAARAATDCNVMKPTPFLQKTSPRLEFVPAFVTQDLHDMTISEIIQKAIEEVSNQ
jgi:hypothetical protein